MTRRIILDNLGVESLQADMKVESLSIDCAQASSAVRGDRKTEEGLAAHSPQDDD